MLKCKLFVRLGLVIVFGVAPLAVAVTPGNAWQEKIIDYETHLNNTDLDEGTYTDWTDLPQPWATGNQWPWVYNSWARNTSQYGGDQPRYGIAVWRVRIPQTGWYYLKASYKETPNRTTKAQYYIYTDVTLDDIRSYTTDKGSPLYHLEFNQNGDDWDRYNYAEFGAFCWKKNQVSVLVLDGRATIRSSSADAAIWTYLGTTYKGEKCMDSSVVAPANQLLLKTPVKGK